MPFRRDLGWVATGAAIADGYLIAPGMQVRVPDSEEWLA
jgi:hypothetical protein